MSTGTNNLEAGIRQPLLPPTIPIPRRSSVGREICRIISRITFSELLVLLITAFTGHVILRTTSLSGYDTFLRETMYLGAVGGAGLYPIVTLYIHIKNHLFPSTQNDGDTSFLNMFVEFRKRVAFGAAAGAIGSTILRNRGGHEFMLDPEHATCAGALGGAVIVPGDWRELLDLLLT
ncbi:hypothetical protein M408DRAFT_13012 [Serendipita vermifera MAFF 305830]|uniref:Uncharacterized protein n=1 Tax=Serendipita vermifera MAFF 305830 TaxID=933852 RepID=A0A0C3AMB7_SERVB|nr:hypothetical protein M408DRAFT_13012 [Serendipita vermifera MAFF 305830]